MSPVVTLGLGALIAVICVVLAGGKGASWCRSYAQEIEDPRPRHTWLLGTAWQAGLALLASGITIGWACSLNAPLEGLLAAPVAVALCQAGSVDAVCHRLPNALLGLAAFPALMSSIVRLAQQPSASAVLTWLGAAALVLVVTTVLASIGSGMGMGDVKLMGVAGLWLGSLSLLAPLGALMGGFLLAGPVALALMALKRIGRKEPMAFGPYLIAGILLSWALSIS
ncbi:hypothetical protein NSA19_08065 [Actinomyces bowdenii]|uniref:prepilin peptidase n=1 Tax=Actinomyces bowdenii TaxID=131109 RepID=UPI00214ACFD4|nr:prepilin peptidase [Actinomyces bowdenii]MCR2052797.1 hypothetical protein [Actinomyces bowdenii]